MITMMIIFIHNNDNDNNDNNNDNNNASVDSLYQDRSKLSTANLRTKFLEFGGFYSSRVLNVGGWNSHVHGESPGDSESTNLRRDNLSRKIGRRSFRCLCLVRGQVVVSTFKQRGGLPETLSVAVLSKEPLGGGFGCATITCCLVTCSRVCSHVLRRPCKIIQLHTATQYGPALALSGVAGYPCFTPASACSMATWYCDIAPYQVRPPLEETALLHSPVGPSLAEFPLDL